MKKFIKYIISIIGVLLLLWAIAGLNIAVQNNNETTSKTSSTTSATRLNVALVNEDKSVISGSRQYNLGASYIKSIERDDSQNWSVVSRGTANSGLESGNYQLVVIIPSDFSSKILDMNSLAAEQTTISYEVNASGNEQIETEANKVGKDIVSDLNNQLVNMYMASILSNLYTAQQNIQTLADQGSTNISSYQSNLLAPALNFETYFPALTTMSNSSLTAHQALVESLSGFSSLYEEFDASQQTFGTDLAALVEQRANNAVTAEEFSQAVMSMDSALLSVDLSNLTNLLADAQSSLAESIQSVGTGGTNNNEDPNIDVNQQDQAAINNLEERIAELRRLVAEQSQQLSEQEARIEEFAEEEVAKYYGDANTLTIAGLLGQEKEDEDGKKSSYLDTSVEQYKQEIAAYEKAVTDMIQAAINQLPTIEDDDLSSLAANMTALDSSAAASVKDFNSDFVSPYSEAFKASGLGDNLATAKSNLDQAKSDLEDAEKTYASTPDTADSPSSENEVTATVTLDLPGESTGFVLDGWSYNGRNYNSGQINNVELTLNSETAFRFNYHYDLTIDEENPTAPTVNDTIIVNIDALSVKTTATAEVSPANYIQALKDYTEAETAYVQIVQRVQDVYSNANALLTQYHSLDSAGKLVPLTDDFFDQPVTDLIKKILVEGIKNNLNAYNNVTGSNADLSKQIDGLEKQKSDLAGKLVEVQGSNISLAEELGKQIEAVQAVQAQVAGVEESSRATSSANSDSDSRLSDLNGNLSQLLSSTANIRSTSESNISEANSVNSLFTSFNSEVETAQRNGAKLSTDAQDLMNEFSKELEASNDFVESFVKVLNNAYSDGVANEALLEFLSNPVNESSSSVKATINTYRPFTWILLLEVVSLFTAYIFATYNLIEKVKDKFKVVDRLHDTDLINVAIISLLAVFMGIVLGAVSASKLAVANSLKPSWVVTVTLFSILLTQGQYFLIKNLKALGMGLSLFMTVSFVYLSNAIGTTATLSGLPFLLKKVNALSILETSLSGYFDGRSASIFLIFLAIVAVVGLVLVNIFFTLNLKEWIKGETEAEA